MCIHYVKLLISINFIYRENDTIFGVNMKVFNVKIANDPEIKDIKALIKKVKINQTNEIEFNEIVKLCSLLDIEYRPDRRRGGSLEKFYSKDLVRVHGYTHGIFSIHIIHKGKAKKMVYRKNFFSTIKHLEVIIKIKESKK